ncbi:MAG: phosphatase PAP2 family protein [Alphaproteobacteria bacterium]|nr:phosphatase PAP2 family protein [Alphaproteobacteria bacterium]
MKKLHIYLFVVFALIVGNVFAANEYRGHPVNDRITRLGDIAQFVPVLSALAYSSFIQDWRGVQQLGLATGSTMATTYTLKYTIREERPYEPEDSKGHTFPSGHTAFAFAGAGYWQMRYGWYVGAPMYAVAAFTGYSRNHARMHNWTDIVVASSIGIGFNYLFTTKYVPENTRISVSPTDGGAMLQFNTMF